MLSATFRLYLLWLRRVLLLQGAVAIAIMATVCAKGYGVLIAPINLWGQALQEHCLISGPVRYAPVDYSISSRVMIRGDQEEYWQIFRQQPGAENWIVYQSGILIYGKRAALHLMTCSEQEREAASHNITRKWEDLSE